MRIYYQVPASFQKWTQTAGDSENSTSENPWLRNRLEVEEHLWSKCLRTIAHLSPHCWRDLNNANHIPSPKQRMEISNEEWMAMKSSSPECVTQFPSMGVALWISIRPTHTTIGSSQPMGMSVSIALSESSQTPVWVKSWLTAAEPNIKIEQQLVVRKRTDASPSCATYHPTRTINDK